MSADKVALMEMYFALNKPEYNVFTLSDKVAVFEGSGDALWHHYSGVIFFGYSKRSDASASEELARITQADVVELKLVSDEFYHLDTCLCLLNHKMALWYPPAFDAASQEYVDPFLSLPINSPYCFQTFKRFRTRSD